MTARRIDIDIYRYRIDIVQGQISEPAYFRVKWRLLSSVSFDYKYFATRAVLMNWGISFGNFPVLAGEYSVK